MNSCWKFINWMYHLDHFSTRVLEVITLCDAYKSLKKFRIQDLYFMFFSSLMLVQYKELLTSKMFDQICLFRLCDYFRFSNVYLLSQCFRWLRPWNFLHFLTWTFNVSCFVLQVISRPQNPPNPNLTPLWVSINKWLCFFPNLNTSQYFTMTCFNLKLCFSKFFLLHAYTHTLILSTSMSFCNVIQVFFTYFSFLRVKTF